MKRSLWLVLVYLLTAVLMLSACGKNVPEAPPQAETETTKTATPTALITPTPPSPPTPPPKPEPAPTPTPTPSPIPTNPADNWGLWGFPAWTADFKSTQGAIVNFVKIDETTKDGKTSINYYLAVVGLPKDRVYYLWLKTLANPTPTQILADTMIDDAGYVITGTVRVAIGAYGYAKGEAMEVALMTQDKTTGGFGKIIPYPIESKQGYYRIWVELFSPKGVSFIIWGEGFEPNEEIDFTCTSDGEVIKSKNKVDSKGRLKTIIFPAVVGKESGLATYTALGKSGEVKVSYEWGPPALRSGP